MYFKSQNNTFTDNKETTDILKGLATYSSKFRFTREDIMHFSQQVNEKWELVRYNSHFSNVISKFVSSYKSIRKVIGHSKQHRNVFLHLIFSFFKQIL